MSFSSLKTYVLRPPFEYGHDGMSIFDFVFSEIILHV